MAKTLVRIRALKLCLLTAAIFFARTLAAANVTLAWDPSSDEPAAYRIYFGVASGAYTSFVEVAAPATTVTISNLLDNATYYFAATALDPSRVESDFSNETVRAATTSGLIAPALSLTTLEDTPLSVTLSAPSVIPLSYGIVTPPTNGRLTGTAPNLVYTPNLDFFGKDQFTYKISNGLVTVSGVVTVNVTAANDAPTLDTIPNVVVAKNSGARNIALSGITSGSANEIQTLTISAASSDTTLIPTPAVSYSSPNATGTLNLKPAVNRSGTATISVTVRDGSAANGVITRSFMVTVQGPPAISHLTEVSNDARTINLTWDTDQSSTCFVEYGPTPALGLTGTTPAGFTHALTLTNLLPGSMYNFRISALGDAGITTQVATVETE
jgi:hypothetical protein